MVLFWTNLNLCSDGICDQYMLLLLLLITDKYMMRRMTMK